MGTIRLNNAIVNGVIQMQAADIDSPPEGVLYADTGSFAFDSVNDVVWVKASGDKDTNTGWVTVAATDQDTGWRKFDEQTLSLDFTGQSGVSHKVSPCFRRIGDRVFFGAVVKRVTAWGGASGNATAALAGDPATDTFLPTFNMGQNAILYNTDGSAIMAVLVSYSSFDSSYAFKLYSYFANSGDEDADVYYFASAGAGTFCNSPFPDLDNLPGVAFDPEDPDQLNPPT